MDCGHAALAMACPEHPVRAVHKQKPAGLAVRSDSSRKAKAQAQSARRYQTPDKALCIC